MPTAQEIPAIVDHVRQRLDEAAQQGIPLQVSEQRLDDDWLYTVVTPSRPGARASDHATLMSQIERELRNAGKDKVLLVPAIED